LSNLVLGDTQVGEWGAHAIPGSGSDARPEAARDVGGVGPGRHGDEPVGAGERAHRAGQRVLAEVALTSSSGTAGETAVTASTLCAPSARAAATTTRLESRIPLVGVGTREAYLAIRADDQLENRFEPFRLPLWQPDPEACAQLFEQERAYLFGAGSPANTCPPPPSWAESICGEGVSASQRVQPVTATGRR
jgi:hypothetical protein